ncbi:hypothetical protein [Marinobacter similis]|uniref:Uncharacterized protein n=1 Tax=Marinobacter similis TaxID=1420916 RepID=W5YLC3_9GAMM|nr:hypothetical protein [Marinobacter similis]AHI29840.1 hypothetical protein AU14_18650 [Marinobacter similis]
MGGKPDIIKAVVLIFAAGLVITGFTTIQASESPSRAYSSINMDAYQAVDSRRNR